MNETRKSITLAQYLKSPGAATYTKGHEKWFVWQGDVAVSVRRSPRKPR